MSKLTNSTPKKRGIAARSKDPTQDPKLQHTRHLVHRTESHIIDTLAVRKVIAALSANWVIRDLTERDYGIDMMVEYFNGQQPTGKIAFFQIKGTSKPIKIRDKQIRFSLHRKTLGYTEYFTVPFFLLYCDVNEIHNDGLARTEPRLENRAAGRLYNLYSSAKQIASDRIAYA
jgi:Domain of unknown function (DUF4365)